MLSEGRRHTPLRATAIEAWNEVARAIVREAIGSAEPPSSESPPTSSLSPTTPPLSPASELASDSDSDTASVQVQVFARRTVPPDEDARRALLDELAAAMRDHASDGAEVSIDVTLHIDERPDTS